MKKSEHTLSSKEYYWRNRERISAWKKQRLKNGREHSYREFTDSIIPVVIRNREEETNENEIEIEEQVCKEFGCGKTLTLTEKLAGNKCLKHQVYVREIF